MTVFDRIARQASHRDTLFSVLLELTYRCDLDCFYCFNDVRKKGTPVSTERYLALLQELRDLNVLNLVLSGGEPLLHPAFWAIGRRARELAFSTRVKTNGHALDGETARRLRDEVWPFMVDVSLHGATAETHDRQTRVAGSFDRLMGNLPAMKAAGLHVKLNSTATAWNFAEIGEMYRIADELGVRLDVNLTVDPRDDGDRTPLAIAPTVEQLRVAAGFLERRGIGNRIPRGADPVDELPESTSPEGRLKNCGVAASTLAVDPYGDVLPCVQWRLPVGNIHASTLPEIWLKNQRLEQVRAMSVQAAQMVASSGPTGPLMAFCPALAVRQTGSPIGIYPAARDRVAAFNRPEPALTAGAEPALLAVEN